MAAIGNKNCLNVYGREEHKKPSLVSINNFQLPKAQRLKNIVTALTVMHVSFLCTFI
jgi:hypothetical protein